MSDNFAGIKVTVLGDSSPFSKTGRSSGYLISIKGKTFLVDCGAPVFQLLTWDEIDKLGGILATHSHDDHRRWFTDLVLFKRYVYGDSPKLKLITSEPIQQEYRETSKAALQRTLSLDSKQVVEIPYKSLVEPFRLGPRAKYKIDNISLTTTRLGSWMVINRKGLSLSPEKAKVVINPKTHSRRMLFKDPATDLWVEPESYYSFSSDVFYEQNVDFIDQGFTIEAIKAANWHGLTGIGVKFTTDNESIIFSGDTTYNLGLFEKLATEVRPLDLDDMSQAEFDYKQIIIGDINKYIQKTWSTERFEDAKKLYQNSVVFHDASTVNSIVHTDYKHLKKIQADKIVLVHTPDKFISTELMTHQDKNFIVEKNNIYEEVKNRAYILNADVYFKHSESFYVGYEDDEGDFKVIEKEHGLLDIIKAAEVTEYKVLFRISLYQDIKGNYYKYIGEPNVEYRVRNDSKIEKVTITDSGSTGEIVAPMPRLLAPFSRKPRNSRTDTSIHPI